MNSLDKFKKYMITEFLAEVAPLVADHAEGATLTDAAGRTYVDAFAGISVCNAGHNNPEVVAAARAQLGKLVHCGTYLLPHAPAADLAELLAEITPTAPQPRAAVPHPTSQPGACPPDVEKAAVPHRLIKTFFGNSGAEANEAAMRLVRQATGKRGFVALDGAFHGRTLATLSISGLPSRKVGGGPYLPDVAFLPAPYCYRCALGLKPESCNLACAAALEEKIKSASDGGVAAMFAEPVQGEGGIIVPPKGWFPAIKKMLERHGVLLVVDEVQTGFGRTGSMFAIEAEGVEPDIITLGKGIADGFPLSAMVTRPDIAAAFHPGDHLSTFGGNPICCAAALATIRFYQREKLPAQAARKGAWLMAELRRRLGNNPRVGEVRGRGLMIGVELVERAVPSALSNAAPPDAVLARKVVTNCRERGVLIGLGGAGGNVLRIQPPLVISDDQLAQVADTVVSALGGFPAAARQA